MPDSHAVSLKGKSALKNPVLLVHGSTANGPNLSVGPFEFGAYFADLPAFLGETGTVVKIAHLPTDASIAERAAVLKNYLETDMKGEMVNIIGHSLGGLDARYAVSILGCNQIASITSIGTPHLGSPLADWAWKQVLNKGFWYWLLKAIGYDLKNRRFIQDITTEGMKVFNEKVRDSLDVRYFSVQTKASFSDGNMSFLLWPTAKWMEGQKHYLTANGHDGMVPFDSQLWGTGVYTGQIDHLAQINHQEFRFTSNRQESMQIWEKIFDNLQKEGL